MSGLKIVVYISYFAGLLLVLAKLHMTLFMTEIINRRDKTCANWLTRHGHIIGHAVVN